MSVPKSSAPSQNENVATVGRVAAVEWWLARARAARQIADDALALARDAIAAQHEAADALEALSR